MFFLSYVCYAFVGVCLYVPCGHLLGKGWPLGSRLWCLTVSLSLSHWYPGSGVVLDCIDSWTSQPYFVWCFTRAIWVEQFKWYSARTFPGHIHDIYQPRTRILIFATLWVLDVACKPYLPKIKKNITKLVDCYSYDWPFKGKKMNGEFIHQIKSKLS